MAEALLEGVRIRFEARGVAVEQVVEPGPHVGQAEHGVVGQLVEADPEAQVVVGQAPVGGELVHVAPDDDELVGRRAGDGQVVLAERGRREVTDHRARGHADEHRGHHPHEVPEHRGRVPGGRVGVGRGGRQRRCQALEAGAEGGQAGLHPLGAGDGDDGDGPTGRGHREPRRLGHLQLGHAGQLFEADALEGVDVGLGLAPGGDLEGELAGGVPADGPLLAQDLGQIAQERDPLEGIRFTAGWIRLTHDGIVRV